MPQPQAHPERGAGWPPRQREDLAERGAALPGGRDQPARLGDRRHHGLGLRSRRAGAPDVDQRVAGSFEWDDRKINLIDTPGEPSFVADALGALRVCESAIFVVNAVMGVEVTRCACGSAPPSSTSRA